MGLDDGDLPDYPKVNTYSNYRYGKPMVSRSENDQNKSDTWWLLWSEQQRWYSVMVYHGIFLNMRGTTWGFSIAMCDGWRVCDLYIEF